ncbi:MULTISPECIES: ABC transporter ATP-binding protein [unclassified Thioalkalivibrio]|uniref:ABC transporter ATP-binding protein n=1 Tax=unclassified Thioalkalivibrio TaxID=2621013 RepID=UPI000363CCFC|nr:MULTISPECIES: ABC transporter ATP-binding protein [unclassified Thioalkalivibrio]
MMAPAIALKSVAKRYAGGRVGLADVDLEVPAGRFFGLLGPNGAGKTTLVGLLTTLVRADRGSIRVCGFDVATQAVAAKACMGVVPQEINFNSFEPVGEIVEALAAYYGLSPRRARERTGQVLEQVGLADRRRQSAWGLSGGMKRRLMIARALVHRPHVLLLDEPTAGVDLEGRHTTWELLRALNADGVTILLTTHYLEEAEALCDSLAILDQGEIVARGETGELLHGLNVQTLVLELSAPLDACPELEGLAIRRVDRWTLEIDLPQGMEVNALFERLGVYGVRVAGLRNKRNRLESLFLQRIAERASASQGAGT